MSCGKQGFHPTFDKVPYGYDKEVWKRACIEVRSDPELEKLPRFRVRLLIKKRYLDIMFKEDKNGS